MPAPDVDSAVIRLDVRKEPPVAVEKEENFFKVVKAAFAQRRKTLLNGLMGSFGSKLSKQELQDVILSCGFSADIRGERLDITDFVALADKIFEVKSEA